MWLYNGKPFTEDMIGKFVGFVYIIFNDTNGKRYVGKKLFTKSKSFQKAGKKKKKRVQSDWVTYTGSNDELNADIAKGHKIRKEILVLCYNKAWMTYNETAEIFARDCLLDENYYNGWVQCKIRANHLKVK